MATNGHARMGSHCLFFVDNCLDVDFATTKAKNATRATTSLNQPGSTIRRRRRQARRVLIIDEVQKAPDWADSVKRLWDEDTHARRRLRVVLLGSSPSLVQQGFTESLAGRFELLPVTHWTASGMGEAFGWSTEQFVFHGGYPGAAPLIGDGDRWSRYICDSLIETTISRVLSS